MVCDINATSDRCFRRHLVVMHATRWSMFRRGTEAIESFSPLSFEEYDRQHISITNHQGRRLARRKRLLREAGVPIVTPAIAAASRRPVTTAQQSAPTARQLHGCSLSVVTTASSVFGTTSSSSSSTDPTPVPSNVAQSQPERAESAVPVAAPPNPVSRTRDVFLLPPVLSPYRPAGYVSETPESISFLSEGGLSEEDRLLSDKLAEIDENRSAYELSE